MGTKGSAVRISGNFAAVRLADIKRHISQGYLGASIASSLRNFNKTEYSQNQHFDRLKRFNRWTARPLFPHSIDPKTQHKYSLPHRLHLLLCDPQVSKAGTHVTALVVLLVVVSCAVSVLQTTPFGEEEGSSNCGNDGGSCEPTVRWELRLVERVCVGAFTLEYVCRLLTAFAMPPPPPPTTNNSHFHPHPPTPPSTHTQHIQVGIYRTFAFLVSPFNVIDLLSILPFYLNLLFPWLSLNLAFVRILRLYRVLLIPEVGDFKGKLAILSKLLLTIFTNLLVFLILSILMLTLFASLLFQAEQGKWDPATGEYLVQSVLPFEADSPSQIPSIPVGLWLGTQTVTTVGFGDIWAKTHLGQTITIVFMYAGVLLLAIPITMLGITIAELYNQTRHKLARERRVTRLVARYLHSLLMIDHTGEYLTKLGAWNTWIQFTKLKRKQDIGLNAVICRKLAALNTAVSEFETRRLRLGGSHKFAERRREEVLNCVKTELQITREEIMKVWKGQIQELRTEMLRKMFLKSSTIVDC